MDNTDLKEKETIRRPFSKKIPLAVLGALMIGVIGSGLWDLLAKPGLSYLGRLLLNTITLGSQSIKDYAYAMAALDPTPIPSLIIFLFMADLPLLFATYLGMDLFMPSFVRKRIEKLKKKDEEGKGNVEKRIWRLEFILMFYLLLLFVGSFTYWQIINQSVLIWRVFNANVQIVAPYIPDAELKKIKADFASIKQKSEFTIIESKLRNIADEHKIVLRSERLW